MLAGKLLAASSVFGLSSAPQYRPSVNGTETRAAVLQGIISLWTCLVKAILEQSSSPAKLKSTCLHYTWCNGRGPLGWPFHLLCPLCRQARAAPEEKWHFLP